MGRNNKGRLGRGLRGREELFYVVGMHVWEAGMFCGAFLGVLWPREARRTLWRLLISFRGWERKKKERKKGRDKKKGNICDGRLDKL